MPAVNGLCLKKHGELIITDGKLTIVKWISTKGRVYYYLVTINGQKYIKPYRLKQPEYDYYYDSIYKTVYIKNDRQKNN